MALTRVWTPSGNYSGGGTKRLIVIHTMEGFTGPNGAYDCAKYFQSDCGASSQVCIDNNRGKIWEGVSRGYGSWTQCSFNSVSVSAEQSGYASWSTDYWLSNRENQLRNMADWIAEEAKKLGIPIKLLNSSQAQGGSWGVCYHSHLGGSGCGHSDPGSPYPINQVLEWAKGGGSPAPAEGNAFMSASSVQRSSGQQVYACVWKDGKVNVKFGKNGTWAACDPTQSPVKSGADISTRSDGGLVVTYTNGSGDVCTFEQGPDGGPWVWDSLEGDAK